MHSGKCLNLRFAIVVIFLSVLSTLDSHNVTCSLMQASLSANSRFKRYSLPAYDLDSSSKLKVNLESPPRSRKIIGESSSIGARLRERSRVKNDHKRLGVLERADHAFRSQPSDVIQLALPTNHRKTPSLKLENKAKKNDIDFVEEMIGVLAEANKNLLAHRDILMSSNNSSKKLQTRLGIGGRFENFAHAVSSQEPDSQPTGLVEVLAKKGQIDPSLGPSLHEAKPLQAAVPTSTDKQFKTAERGNKKWKIKAKPQEMKSTLAQSGLQKSSADTRNNSSASDLDLVRPGYVSDPVSHQADDSIIGSSVTYAPPTLAGMGQEPERHELPFEHRPIVAHDLLHVNRQPQSHYHHHHQHHQPSELAHTPQQALENMFARVSPGRHADITTLNRPVLIGNQLSNSPQITYDSLRPDYLIHGLAHQSKPAQPADHLQELHGNPFGSHPSSPNAGLQPLQGFHPQQAIFSGPQSMQDNPYIAQPDLGLGQVQFDSRLGEHPLRSIVDAARNQQEAAMAYERRRMAYESELRQRQEAARKHHEQHLHNQRRQAEAAAAAAQEQQNQHQQPAGGSDQEHREQVGENGSVDQHKNGPEQGEGDENGSANQGKQEAENESEEQSNTHAEGQQTNQQNDADMKEFQNFVGGSDGLGGGSGGGDDFTDLFPPGIFSPAEIQEMKRDQEEASRKQQQQQQQEEQEGADGNQEQNDQQEQPESEGEQQATGEQQASEESNGAQGGTNGTASNSMAITSTTDRPLEKQPKVEPTKASSTGDKVSAGMDNIPADLPSFILANIKSNQTHTSLAGQEQTGTSKMRRSRTLPTGAGIDTRPMMILDSYYKDFLLKSLNQSRKPTPRSGSSSATRSDPVITTTTRPASSTTEESPGSHIGHALPIVEFDDAGESYERDFHSSGRTH